jgi:hypothetical protein
MTQQLAHAAGNSKIPQMVILPVVVSCAAKSFFLVINTAC